MHYLQRATSDEGVPEREQAPYKAALELELWKEMEQEKFVKGKIYRVAGP